MRPALWAPHEDRVELGPRHHPHRVVSEHVSSLEKQVERKIVLIAGSAMNDPQFVRPATAGGYGLDSQWNSDFHHSMRTVFTSERDSYLVDYQSAEDTAKALRQGIVLDERYSEFPPRQRHISPPATCRT